MATDGMQIFLDMEWCFIIMCVFHFSAGQSARYAILAKLLCYGMKYRLGIAVAKISMSELANLLSTDKNLQLFIFTYMY